MRIKQANALVLMHPAVPERGMYMHPAVPERGVFTCSCARKGRVHMQLCQKEACSHAAGPERGVFTCSWARKGHVHIKPYTALKTKVAFWPPNRSSKVSVTIGGA